MERFTQQWMFRRSWGKLRLVTRFCHQDESDKQESCSLNRLRTSSYFRKNKSYYSFPNHLSRGKCFGSVHQFFSSLFNIQQWITSEQCWLSQIFALHLAIAQLSYHILQKKCGPSHLIHSFRLQPTRSTFEREIIWICNRLRTCPRYSGNRVYTEQFKKGVLYTTLPSHSS